MNGGAGLALPGGGGGGLGLALPGSLRAGGTANSHGMANGTANGGMGHDSIKVEPEDILRMRGGAVSIR